MITFLVGNPYKPSFATVTGWGVDPINTVDGRNPAPVHMKNPSFFIRVSYTSQVVQDFFYQPSGYSLGVDIPSQDATVGSLYIRIPEPKNVSCHPGGDDCILGGGHTQDIPHFFDVFVGEENYLYFGFVGFKHHGMTKKKLCFTVSV